MEPAGQPAQEIRFPPAARGGEPCRLLKGVAGGPELGQGDHVRRLRRIRERPHMPLHGGHVGADVTEAHVELEQGAAHAYSCQGLRKPCIVLSSVSYTWRTGMSLTSSLISETAEKFRGPRGVHRRSDHG